MQTVVVNGGRLHLIAQLLIANPRAVNGLVRLGVFCGRDCWVLHEKNRSFHIRDYTSGILIGDFTQCANELVGASIPIETLRISSSVGFAHIKRVLNGTGQVVA